MKINKQWATQNIDEIVFLKNGKGLILVGIKNDKYALVKKLRGKKTYICEYNELFSTKPLEKNEIKSKELKNGDYFAIGELGNWKPNVFKYISQENGRIKGICIATNTKTEIGPMFDIKLIKFD